MQTPTFEEVGARIRALRVAKNLTQVEFAELMGVSQAAVSNWETGARLDHVKLAEIAEALGSTLAELLAPEDEASGGNGGADPGSFKAAAS